MKAVMFVNGMDEVDRVIILMKAANREFDFKVVESFDFLMNQFENEKVDVFICQLGLDNCSAKELFQLARMYNPDIINIATGKSDCVEELVDTFNTENLFRFISMPWLYKDDIIGPIRDAIDSIHQKTQEEYDLKAMEEDVVTLKKKVEKLTENNPLYDTLFKDFKEVLHILLLQNYHFSSAADKEKDTELALFAYDNYIKYFYNNIDDLNPLLKEIVSKYREPTQGKFFSIKHNLTDEVKDEVRSRIVFILYILNYYISSVCTEYKIKTLIGITGGHYLLKYEFNIPNKEEVKFLDSMNQFRYKMVDFYVRGCSLRTDSAVEGGKLEYKIIIL